MAPPDDAPAAAGPQPQAGVALRADRPYAAVGYGRVAPATAGAKHLPRAFEMLKGRIVARRGELSLKMVRRLLEQELAFTPHTLDIPPAKRWVADAVQRLMHESCPPDGRAGTDDGNGTSSCLGAAAPAVPHRRTPPIPEHAGYGGDVRVRFHASGRRRKHSGVAGPWAALPTDLLLGVLAALDDKPLASALQTCRAWSGAAGEPSLWWLRLEGICARITGSPYQLWLLQRELLLLYGTDKIKNRG